MNTILDLTASLVRKNKGCKRIELFAVTTLSFIDTRLNFYFLTKTKH